MKKTAFFLSLILVFSSFLFSISAISAFATDESNLDVLNEEAHNEYLWEALFGSSVESTINEYDSFLTSYFDNLTYNFGVNYKGSCGYIAMAMLLSYYDTYLSDRIVPEQYDIASSGNEENMVDRRNSPGVSRDLIVNPNNTSDCYDYAINLTAMEYYSHMESLQNSSLQAKLITIGATRAYYDFNNNVFPAGTNFNNRYDVLTRYLSNVANVPGNQYEISFLNHEDDETKSDLVKEFAINHVKAGRPVLLAIKGNNGGHAVVAYDYNETTKELYCHMGWGANQTHVTPESEGFSVYRSALAIEFNFDHSPSNNYSVTTITNNYPKTKYYCYNDCEIISYSENNSNVEHNCSYKYISSEEHVFECGCENIYNLQSHNLIYSYYTPIQHYKNCEDCIYSGPEFHNYKLQKSSSSTGHNLICACGDKISEAHYVDNYKSKNAQFHYVYCECGADMGFDVHNMVPSSKPLFSVCRECGYERSNLDSGLIIKGEKDESVTE